MQDLEDAGPEADDYLHEPDAKTYSRVRTFPRALFGPPPLEIDLSLSHITPSSLPPLSLSLRSRVRSLHGEDS